MSRQQKSTKYPIKQSIPFLLHRIASVFTQNMLADLRPAKVNIGRWRVLATLMSEGQLSIGELAAFIGIRQPVISRLVTEMQRDGLATRKGGGPDQRVVKIRLTKQGEDLFLSLIPNVQKRRDAALEGLSAQDRARLVKYLSVIQHNIGIVDR